MCVWQQCEAPDVFTRLWIYSHHIYSKVKRRDMLELARDCAVTGFSLPGKPGIICVEGPAANTADWWKRVSERRHCRGVVGCASGRRSVGSSVVGSACNYERGRRPSEFIVN